MKEFLNLSARELLDISSSIATGMRAERHAWRVTRNGAHKFNCSLLTHDHFIIFSSAASNWSNV